MHGEAEKFVVTLLVMRDSSASPGAPRACVDFRDPTAVSRFNMRHALPSRVVSGECGTSSPVLGKRATGVDRWENDTSSLNVRWLPDCRPGSALPGRPEMLRNELMFLQQAIKFGSVAFCQTRGPGHISRRGLQGASQVIPFKLDFRFRVGRKP